MKQGRLILLCGLPGAGKSTLADKLAGKLSATVMSPDKEMYERGIDLYDEKARAKVETEQWLRAKELIKKGETLILENGFGDAPNETLCVLRLAGLVLELNYTILMCHLKSYGNELKHVIVMAKLVMH